MNQIHDMTPTTDHKRVVVAMSGGVDSSVAAALLKERGFEVIGVTLKLQPQNPAADTKSCRTFDGTSRARAVADILQIPHHVIPCEKEFEDAVLKPAWTEYASGRTPSPCLWCNERIKFGLLVDWAQSIGVDGVATGHYAQIDDDDGSPILLRAIDRNKDQSYFLARLTAAQLRHVVFPIGDLHKQDVRAAARRFELPNAEQTESQDACLVAAGDSFAEALRQRFRGTARPGAIVDRSGKIVGHHEGIHRFTIGQRQGLQIASPTRSWVSGIESNSGTIRVTNQEQDLITRNLVTTETCWVGHTPDTWPLACEVQVRYRHAPVPAEVEPLGPGSVRVALKTGVRAITPGQAAVFYRGERVLGSGWISATA
jgi:tRNA (5-methylaminomethyl-2-thiouridylate)-methyltransferase